MSYETSFTIDPSPSVEFSAIPVKAATPSISSVSKSNPLLTMKSNIGARISSHRFTAPATATNYSLSFRTDISTTGPITTFEEDTIPFDHSVYGFAGFAPVFELLLVTEDTYIAIISYCKNCKKKTETFTPIATSDGYRVVFTLPCSSRDQVRIILRPVQ